MKATDIEQLCVKRLDLIDQLEMGSLTKEDFILENHKMLSHYVNVKPIIHSVDEGVVKYHYYNTQAKKMMIEADDFEFRNPQRYFELKNQAYEWYVKKDKITLQLLELIAYSQVSAYFIHMDSRHLEGQIYEINLLAYDRVVLHSKDKKILHKLKVAGCFEEQRLPSIVQRYINTKVY